MILYSVPNSAYPTEYQPRPKSRDGCTLSLSITVPSHRLRLRAKPLAASVTAFACCNCLLPSIPASAERSYPRHSKTCGRLHGLIAPPTTLTVVESRTEFPAYRPHPHPHGLIVSHGIRFVPECQTLRPLNAQDSISILLTAEEGRPIQRSLYRAVAAGKGLPRRKPL
jgi:hypothetical protein